MLEDFRLLSFFNVIQSFYTMIDSLHIPRAEYLKIYFQDDIFPPIRSKRSEITIDDWNNLETPSSYFFAVLESLRPVNDNGEYMKVW